MEGREGRKGERGDEGDPKELVLFLAFIRGLLRPLCKWPERHCARQGKAFNGRSKSLSETGAASDCISSQQRIEETISSATDAA